MTNYFARMLILAAYCILRITRSYLSEKFNFQSGEDMFFKAIAMSKKRSIQNNDLDSLSGTMLTQLWSSNRIFKRQDGTACSLQLSLRVRLVRLKHFSSQWLTFYLVQECCLRLLLVVANGVC
jgi:transcriptional regulatory protein LEU3